jgi:uncharacterized protein YktB (UPF0637 family)
MANNENTSDFLYKWMIRGLYTSAILLNIYFLYQQNKETESGQELQRKYNDLKSNLSKPFRDRKHFRKQATETLVEAWLIVDEAKETKTEGDEQ